MTARLGLVRSTIRQAATYGWRGRKTREWVVTFQDWTVDGVPLRDVISSRVRNAEISGPVEGVTYLVDGATDVAPYVDQLLGRASSDLDDGRVPLLVCLACGDLGCGAITAGVAFTGATAQWRHLGWQSTYDPDVTYFEPSLSLEFDRRSYEELMGRIERAYSSAT